MWWKTTAEVSPRKAGQPVFQGLALQVLHHHERLNGAVGIVFADVVDGADVRMIERRGSPRFALEALQGLGVPSQLVGQEFERHPAAQPAVVSRVDHPHTPTAELGHDLVVRNDLTDHAC